MMTNAQDSKSLENPENIKRLLVLVSIVGVIIIASVIAWNTYQSSGELETANRISKFEAETLKSYSEDKMDIESFSKELRSLAQEVRPTTSIIAIIPGVSDLMLEKKHGDQLLQFFELIKSNLSSSDAANYIFLSNYSALLENQGQIKKSIEVLKGLLNSKLKDEKKIYLSLGRLYLIDSNIEQAKVHFDFLKKEYPSSQEAKLATAYMNQVVLNQKFPNPQTGANSNSSSGNANGDQKKSVETSAGKTTTPKS